jgi:hypothetical protein
MIRKIVCINAVLMVLLSGFFFIYPAIRASLDISDPALRQPGIPKAAWRLYRNLTPRYTNWARKRVAEGRAESLSTRDISGTEWPPFGSVFYLWAIENLQAAWQREDHAGVVEPKTFARDAIVATSELVIDPKHAAWVRKHWGEDYLHRENVFYRMLVIAALTTREKLLGGGAHIDLLRDQVETLAQELDSSKTGLLEDYPGECYPGDVMAAVMCIKRADAVLGTDHSEFINRALRGFTGARASTHHLPPYSAGAATGFPASEARGCANSYMCLTAPELWPAQARQWYDLYDKFFWQERITAVGYREYARDFPHSEWTMDVDAGPVIAGHGVSASAFGIGAARKNGRFDRAYPLAAEMLATVVELPTGVLAMPRLLSNFSDAPMLGEAAILWQLSIQPQKGFPVKTGSGSIPAYVYIVLTSMFVFGAWRILAAIWTLREARHGLKREVLAPRIQAALWVCFVLVAIATLATGHQIIGMVVLVIAVMMPVVKRTKVSEVEEWPEANFAPAKEGQPDALNR